MTRSVPLEVAELAREPLARPERSVTASSNRTAEALTARLVQIAEDLARVAADVVVTLHAPPAPVVLQPAPAEARVAWTVAEFAKAHSLAKGTVYELIKRGEIQAGRVNESLRISEEERLRWWAECQQRHAADLGVA